MKKVLLLFFGFPFLCVSFTASLLVLIHSEKTNIALADATAPRYTLASSPQYYAALPHVLGVMSADVGKDDARVELIRKFLAKHESPFTEFAPAIIEQSDKYNIDFRMIAAVGMCESNLGKVIPEGSYNAWGLGIYTGKSSGAEFANWEEAIKVMAKYLSEKYYAKGLTTPLEMGPIYAPPSVNTGNSWANCVEKFMEELT